MSKTKHLVLDIGNTHTKYGYFEAGKLLDSGLCTHWDSNEWDLFHQQTPFTKVLVGTVGAITKQILSLLPKSCDVVFIDDTTQYPFSSAYDNIHALGTDRRAGLAGAMLTHPNTSVLIIDAGSCITYDYLDASGHHAGGAISPGRGMRYSALHMFTANLPLLDPIDTIPEMGISTATSMSLGVEAGVVAEIHAQIEAFSKKFGNFTIILTGGDANFLIKNIKYPIFASDDLILSGLQHLLMFNSLHEK